MANIIDYLSWRGDLSLSNDPINEIDGAILARLAYMRYEKINIKKNESLYSALKTILSLPNIENIQLIEGDSSLMKTIIGTKRFSSFVIIDYTNEIDEKTQTQFSAITLLEKESKTLFVLFRGTDNTLVGWKEDFNMAFSTPLIGQIKAVDYLTKMSSTIENNSIIVSGHSKGGNLAVFASSFVDKKVQDKIEVVFNFDGPGFDERTIKEKGYEAICSKIKTFVPQSSVVGMLLEHEEKYTVVHSENISIMQHDIYSWSLLANHFIHLDTVDNSSRFIDYTLKTWLKSMDEDEREKLIDGIYSVMVESNAKTLKELKENWLKSSKGIIKATINLDSETKKAVSSALSSLLKSSKFALTTIVDKPKK